MVKNRDGRDGGIRVMLKVVLGVLCITLAVSSVSSAALAEDMVTLGELLPALSETDVASSAVAKAPAAGTSRRIPRRQVIEALKLAGLDASQFELPRSFVVSRRARSLDSDELQALLSSPLSEVLSPCRVSDVRAASTTVRVPGGALKVMVERRPILRSGRMTIIVTLAAGTQTVRVPVSANAQCPPPVVNAGANVQLVVRIGAVRAYVDGTAYQAGRVGDVVRVRNSMTGAMVKGRVLDAHRVEIQR